MHFDVNKNGDAVIDVLNRAGISIHTSDHGETVVDWFID
jgi:hypothetical protein